jgi:MoxR-like ATPase
MQITFYLAPLDTNTLQDSKGNLFNDSKSIKINKATISKAIREGKALKCVVDGDTVKMTTTQQVEVNLKGCKPLPIDLQILSKVADVPKEQAELMSFIQTSTELKPSLMKMGDLKWKYLVRSAVRGKNIMMTGAAGCGKTMAAKSLVNALDRPEFYFNLGATQDPRSTLIGNTHFNKEKGTFFSQATFVKAIQTPNAVILLDELSRAHPDAWNILMTVLDPGQRYLRLDEADGSPTISVAPGVCFIATANIGNEYTSTRVMDKALMDRFIVIEMDMLDKLDEVELLKELYPNLDMTVIDNIASIAEASRKEINTDQPRISTAISTRTTVEMASIMYDGFELLDAAEVTVYPQYDSSGGVDSERTFIKQIVQKFVDDGTDEDLFNADETNEENE